MKRIFDEKRMVWVRTDGSGIITPEMKLEDDLLKIKVRNGELSGSEILNTPMTEPNMEWKVVSEKILAVIAARFDRSFSVDDYIELVDKAISEAEQRGYDKGVAAERRRIAEIVEIKKLPVPNRHGEWVRVRKYNEVMDDIISLIHDNK